MSHEQTRGRRKLVLLFVIYAVVGLASCLAFKQGGTDRPHRVLYFILGNACGITSTWLLMKVYVRMNANLATAIANGAVFVLFQLAAAWLWLAPLTALQWVGIATVLVGTLMATWARTPGAAETPVGRETQGRGLKGGGA